MHTHRPHVFGAVLIAVTIALSACTGGGADSTPALDELRAQHAELVKRAQRTEDMLEIQKLQAKYTHYLFTQDFDRIFEETMAKHAPDLTVEFSDSGVYRGQEHVKALYDAFSATKQIPGFFIMHIAASPFIEIAADGQTAKAHWLSPGVTGNINRSGWVWGPYYVDYIKEDGQWRIWHSNLAALFRNAYEYSWATAPDHGTVRGTLAVEPDEPPTLYRPYNEVKTETDIFKNHPNLPAPY